MMAGPGWGAGGFGVEVLGVGEGRRLRIPAATEMKGLRGAP